MPDYDGKNVNEFDDELTRCVFASGQPEQTAPYYAPSNLTGKRGKAVMCAFGPDLKNNRDRTYEYLIPQWLELDLGKIVKGSYAVVETPTGYNIVKVMSEPMDIDIKFTTRPLVDIIDFSSYQAFLESRKQAAVVRAQLHQMRKAQSEMDLFDQLAAKNPEAAALVAKLKELGV